MNLFCLITTTFPSYDTAQLLMDRLLEEKLAACIHLQEIQSFYLWEGKKCNEPEFLLTIKTRKSLYEKIEATIMLVHPYDTPQIIQVPIEQGYSHYLKWIEETTLQN